MPQSQKWTARDGEVVSGLALGLVFTVLNEHSGKVKKNCWRALHGILPLKSILVDISEVLVNVPFGRKGPRMSVICCLNVIVRWRCGIC